MKIRTYIILTAIALLTSCRTKTDEEKYREASDYLASARKHVLYLDSVVKHVPEPFWEKQRIKKELSALKVDVSNTIALVKSIKSVEKKKTLMYESGMYDAVYKVISPDISILKDDNAMEMALKKYDTR